LDKSPLASADPAKPPNEWQKRENTKELKHQATIYLQDKNTMARKAGAAKEQIFHTF